jgi:hypothetical protein
MGSIDSGDNIGDMVKGEKVEKHKPRYSLNIPYWTTPKSNARWFVGLCLLSVIVVSCMTWYFKIRPQIQFENFGGYGEPQGPVHRRFSRSRNRTADYLFEGEM